MLLLGLEVAYARAVAGARGGWWLIAVAGALSLYAGFPEVAYLDSLFAVGWFVWRATGLGGRGRRMFAGKAAAGLGAAILLSAPLLVPFAEYLGQGALGSHADGVAGHTHLATPALSQLLLPYVFGPIFAFGDTRLTLTTIWSDVGGYLATSLLFFGLVGLSGPGFRKLKLVLMSWIVLALARCTAGRSPWATCSVFSPACRVWPSFVTHSPRSSSRSSSSPRSDWTGSGAHGRRGDASHSRPPRRSCSSPPQPSRRVHLHTVSAAFSHDHPYFWGSVGWGAALVLRGPAAALAGRCRVRGAHRSATCRRGRLRPLHAPGGLGSAASPRSISLPVQYLQRHLGNERFFTLGPLQPNYGSYFGISELNINELPVPRAFADYVHRRLDQVVDPTVLVGNLGGGRPAGAPSPAQELVRNLDGYRATGVAYVLAPAGQSLPAPAFTLVLRTPTTWIYYLAGAAPYLGVPGCTVVAASRTSARVTCPTPTRLVRLETDYPGWSARIDGHATPIRRVDGLFQAVTVPAGSHRVTFAYAPRHITWAYAAFAAGVLSLLIPALVSTQGTQPTTRRGCPSVR